MAEHELKTWPAYFAALWDRSKHIELRPDDRGFRVGDTLVLREYNPALSTYTGRSVDAEIEYILRRAPNFGLMDGFCIMSLRRLEWHDEGRSSQTVQRP